MKPGFTLELKFKVTPKLQKAFLPPPQKEMEGRREKERWQAFLPLGFASWFAGAGKQETLSSLSPSMLCETGRLIETYTVMEPARPCPKPATLKHGSRQFYSGAGSGASLEFASFLLGNLLQASPGCTPVTLNCPRDTAALWSRAFYPK